ncbi:MAG: hypothetical protein HC924_13945 [Synechococcaceae cyanobacterium SM2_3_2]|nr:hypothetical protein [Synechococcaceae cyanobacterium SM2_3_2]
MFKSLIAKHYQAQGILPDGILAQVSDALRLDEAPQEYDIKWQVINNQLTPVFVCYDNKTVSWIQQHRSTLRWYASQFMKAPRWGRDS